MSGHPGDHPAGVAGETPTADQATSSVFRMSGMTFRRIAPRHLLVAAPVLGYLAISTIFALKLVNPYALTVMSGLSLTVAAIGAGAACLARSRSLPDPRT